MLAYLAFTWDHWSIPHGWPRALTFYGLLALIVFAVHLVRRPKIKRLKRGPDFEGPALTGTARILSMKPNDGRRYLGLTKVVYRMTLRVEVPGHQQYDVTTAQVVTKPIYLSAQRGETIVAVEVDSTNPERVRIDFTQPIT